MYTTYYVLLHVNQIYLQAPAVLSLCCSDTKSILFVFVFVFAFAIPVDFC